MQEAIRKKKKVFYRWRLARYNGDMTTPLDLDAAEAELRDCSQLGAINRITEIAEQAITEIRELRERNKNMQLSLDLHTSPHVVMLQEEYQHMLRDRDYMRAEIERLKARNQS